MIKFKKDQLVRYIPDHAKNDWKHPDCEIGKVSSQNDTYVFVRYVNKFSGLLSESSQATRYENIQDLEPNDS